MQCFRFWFCGLGMTNYRHIIATSWFDYLRYRYLSVQNCELTVSLFSSFKEWLFPLVPPVEEWPRGFCLPK